MAYKFQLGLAILSGSLVRQGTTELSGGVISKSTSVSDDYTFTTSDYYIGVDTSASPVTLTAPSVSSATEGQTFLIKDEAGNASTNPITINTTDARVQNLNALSMDHGEWHWFMADTVMNDNNEETYSCWINNQNSGSWNTIFRHTDEREIVISPSNKFVFKVFVLNPGNTRYFETDDPIPYDEWVHVAVTYLPIHLAGGEDNGARECKIYVNGTQVSSSGTDQDIGDSEWSPQAVRVGDSNHPNTGWGGYIADLAIWNRKLSAADISTVYNHSPRNFNTDGPYADNLIWWYRMGDSPGDSLDIIYNASSADDAGTSNLSASSENPTTELISISKTDTMPNPEYYSIDGAENIEIDSEYGAVSFYLSGVRWFAY